MMMVPSHVSDLRVQNNAHNAQGRFGWKVSVISGGRMSADKRESFDYVGVCV